MARIVGIDVSAEPRKVGLALGVTEDAAVRVLEVRAAGTWDEIDGIVADWARGSERTLLALDAPLGWPRALGRELSRHVAGAVIRVDPNQLFRRETDRFVKERIGKQPHDVGADRIARTAAAALALLGRLEEELDRPIPLAWQPDFPQFLAVIEVYPAATLAALGIGERGYKDADRVDRRREILAEVGILFDRDEDLGRAAADADALDAVLCAFAGADFLGGRAMAPKSEVLARREGWIQVRPPGTGGER